MILPLEDIRSRLQDRRPFMVAKETGLHVNTIKGIRDDPGANPTYKAIKALSEYLTQKA